MSAIEIRQVSIIIEDDEVGFSLNCKKDNIILFFKTKSISPELLSLISKRLTQDMELIVNSTVDMTKIEDNFNDIVAKTVAEEQNESSTIR